MKLNMNKAMDDHRKVAETIINGAIAREASPIDHEHILKRQIARRIIDNPNDPIPSEISDEAALTGITPQALAQQILDKPDEVLARGLRRRTDVIAVRKAASPEEIKAILQKYTSPGE